MRFLLFIPIICIIACSNRGDGLKPSSPTTPVDTTFTNPLLTSGPDPWVIQQDTMYYYMNTQIGRAHV